MHPHTALGLVLAAILFACSPPKTPPPAAPAADVAADVPDVSGPAGGSDEEGLQPNHLTGVPGIDRAEDLVVRVLDAKGTARVGGSPVTVGTLPMGQWLLSDAGSEFEITIRSSLMPDGVVRLKERSALLIEPLQQGAVPRFRVFGGQASFYMPHLPPGEVTVVTPAGTLFTRGAVFSVTVSPDFQALITCREGSLYLNGLQNAVVQPGQVVVADRFGRSRVYPMTPNEAQVFSDRWLTVTTEEASKVDRWVLSRRLAAWKSLEAHQDAEQAQFLALWFREAKTVLGSQVPGPETWGAVLAAPVRSSAWQEPLQAPGLLGESP